MNGILGLNATLTLFYCHSLSRWNLIILVAIFISESGLSDDYGTFEMLTSKDMNAVMAGSIKYFYRNGNLFLNWSNNHLKWYYLKYSLKKNW